MAELPETTCPACDLSFTVIFDAAKAHPLRPEYCPFCGEEFDYEEYTKDE